MDHMQYGLTPPDFKSNDAASATESTGLTQHSFLIAAPTSGFALASNPILAQAIKTDSDGATTG